MLIMSLGESGYEPLTRVPAEPVGGGMVNEAARVETKRGSVFVKWNMDAPPRTFECEADGLRRLAATNTLRIPEVLDFTDASDSDRINGWPSYLILEWIEQDPPRDPRAFCRGFAGGLAALHRHNPAPDGMFGLERDNYLGSQPQDNTRTASWPEFYRDRRVLPQMERARRLGRLPGYRERMVVEVCERMADLMDGIESRPVLEHGDLWSGNYLTVGDEAVVIDPAVYYADREVEMAYVELFGGFPVGFVEAYDAAYPLDPGYEYRRPLHQLYPLLIHLNHFGETYGPAVDQACRIYLR